MGFGRSLLGGGHYVPTMCMYGNLDADLPGLCVFFQQIMHYFLANYTPKILNYARIMRIAQYFEAKNCFNLLTLSARVF